jgi:hypothetical protein
MMILSDVVLLRPCLTTSSLRFHTLPQIHQDCSRLKATRVCAQAEDVHAYIAYHDGICFGSYD